MSPWTVVDPKRVEPCTEKVALGEEDPMPNSPVLVSVNAEVSSEKRTLKRLAD